MEDRNFFPIFPRFFLQKGISVICNEIEWRSIKYLYKLELDWIIAIQNQTYPSKS